MSNGRGGRGTSARNTGANTVSMSLDLAGLGRLLDELGDQAEAAARPAAQAAAQVLYDEVQRNVNGMRRYTGNLARSIYQVYSTTNSADGRATYHVSWNAKKAPHGWLVENGYLQRYAYYRDEQGRVRPMVRPEAKGRRKPKRRATRAEKDAYYVTLPQPKQVPGRSFARKAYAAKSSEALAAAERVLLQRLLRGRPA